MRLYYIEDKYIKFLQQYDSKVPLNKDGSRPYVGIVFSIKEINYYAPLSSPKAKHKTMKTDKDFRKISNGALGVINFNNMIPVPPQVIKEIDINNIVDNAYRNLLFKQQSAISDDEEKILSTATKLYDIVISDTKSLNKHECIVKERCCNFEKLEEIYELYKP